MLCLVVNIFPTILGSYSITGIDFSPISRSKIPAQYTTVDSWKPEAGVLDESYAAMPAQRSSHTGTPSYIGCTNFSRPGRVSLVTSLLGTGKWPSFFTVQWLNFSERFENTNYSTVNACGLAIFFQNCNFICSSVIYLSLSEIPTWTYQRQFGLKRQVQSLRLYCNVCLADKCERRVDAPVCRTLYPLQKRWRILS